MKKLQDEKKDMINLFLIKKIVYQNIDKIRSLYNHKL